MNSTKGKLGVQQLGDGGGEPKESKGTHRSKRQLTAPKRTGESPATKCVKERKQKNGE